MDPSTGLTHLGAREYDPTNGRFLSVDPVIDTDDPQQMNGYAYSNNNPRAEYRHYSAAPREHALL